MKKIECCIFDLDGVIIDTAKFHFLSWKKLTKQLNIDFTEKDNERLKGVSRTRSLEIILEIGNKSLDEKTKANLAEKKNKWYLEYITQLTPRDVLPRVKEFMTELKENDVKIALGSASKNAKLVLEKIKLSDYFDAIVDGNRVKNPKPNPEVFTKGADELTIPYENCIVFEDAQAGIKAALNAGMKVVGVGKEESLEQADYIIDGFKNICFKTLQTVFVK